MPAFVISFQKLLKDVVACLSFPEPIYGSREALSPTAYVVIMKKLYPKCYMFNGLASDTLEDSKESAAQQASHFLINKFHVRVEDISYFKKAVCDRITSLLKLKVKQLDHLNNGGIGPKPYEVGGCRANESKHIVSIDYVEALKGVVAELGITDFSIESVECSRGCFVCWAVINCPDNDLLTKKILGDECVSVELASQNLAKKVILELQRAYKFLFIDANYHCMDSSENRCDKVRETYLAMKALVVEGKDCSDDGFVKIEEECVTPHGVEHQIPVSLVPPPAPKKRRSSAGVSTSQSVAPRMFSKTCEDLLRLFEPSRCP